MQDAFTVVLRKSG